MTTRSVPLRVPLRPVSTPGWAPGRLAEPLVAGVPLPRGAASSPAELSLETAAGQRWPLQTRVLDRWPDGSIRWALLQFASDPAGPPELVIGGTGASPVPPAPPMMTRTTAGIRVETGAATFEIARGGVFPLSSVHLRGTAAIAPGAPMLHVGHGGREQRCDVASVDVHESGPLRVELHVTGVVAGTGDLPLVVSARVEFFAGSATTRIHVTLRNSRAAVHPNGQWGLGDAGSIGLESVHLRLTPPAPIVDVSAAIEAGGAFAPLALPFSLLQESSGGESWNSRNHLGANGLVLPRFRGYRAAAGTMEMAGLRATPIVTARTEVSEISVAVPHFWQNFPSALEVSAEGVDIALFPRDAAAPHELQGGEQKTWTLAIAFEPDRVSNPPLAWVHDPQLLFPDPKWCCESGAVPFLVPESQDDSGPYLDMVAEALDSSTGFAAKREAADEYGWRHFGDLPADHESAFQPADRTFVSHYNNQYDAIAGFGLQFLRTGNGAWWTLMSDLARHVRDIDIYHTAGDKSAYNGGLFWHTAHYVDAGTSTHRTYPPGSAHSGGPSAEHNYNIGLMLHYFLTGDDASRAAAIDLGQWVLEMDDGAKTIFRVLTRSATGHATFTNGFYGPGRGAGHSILACVVAHRLSGDANFLAKAEELIQRTASPNDDIDAHDLLNAELRWSYTAFLQATGVYLFHKLERGEMDHAFNHARLTLLHYARWMRDHERPYLDFPERLEYPTETWAAQDVRKGDVLLWAALFGETEERAGFLARARYFFDYALTTLGQMPTRHFTRPIVIVLSHGLRHGWLLKNPDSSILPGSGWPSADRVVYRTSHFRPQRAIAKRRVVFLASGALVFALVLVLAFVGAW